jgi:hypothetical protein
MNVYLFGILKKCLMSKNARNGNFKITESLFGM